MRELFLFALLFLAALALPMWLLAALALPMWLFVRKQQEDEARRRRIREARRKYSR